VEVCDNGDDHGDVMRSVHLGSRLGGVTGTQDTVDKG
jgi:hypothetical protein